MGEMVTIREADLIESVADALQYISYFHPMDYIRARFVAANSGSGAKSASPTVVNASSP